jgi:1-acyl-sn-glycerol-3-phosphate acyltransferase
VPLETSEIDHGTLREPHTLDLPPSPPLRPPAPRRYGWLSRLRSYCIFDPLIWLYTVVMGLVSIPVSLFGDRERILHSFARAWSWLIMKTILSPVRVTGLDQIDTTRPYVYAVNHASALDIPVLYVNLPFQFRIVFKSELLAYPIVGWHLKRAGQVCVNQQNPAHSISSMRAALKSLQSGLPLVIFPEGGRTPDGKIRPFLPGAFFLAIKAKVDVVPVALVGTYDLLPMNTYHIKCRPLEMRVGRPISVAGLKGHDMEALSAQVQKAVEELHERPS